MTKRLLLIACLLALLAGLSVYTAHVNPWLDVVRCLQDPVAYDGRIVNWYREPLVGEIYANGFQLLQRQTPSIRVYADTSGLVSGEYIGMKAVFHKQGYLEAVSLQPAKNRRKKIGVSVAPALLVALLLVRYYRINPKKFHIERRKHA